MSEKSAKRNEWWDWTKAILIALGIMLIVRQFIIAPIVVDGPSMMPTLHDRDHMIVNKFVYRLHEPKRFDVVVFHATEEKNFIKRVIGLPGEHVAVRDNVLYINGKEVNEQFLNETKKNLKPYEILTNDFSLEDTPGAYQKIPEGYVFVMGDNRNNSADSRIIGVVPIDEIIGKTSVMYWPVKRIRIIGE